MTTARRTVLRALALLPFFPAAAAASASPQEEPWRGVKHSDGGVSWWLSTVAVAQDGLGSWMWGVTEVVDFGDGRPVNSVILVGEAYPDARSAMKAARDSLPG